MSPQGRSAAARQPSPVFSPPIDGGGSGVHLTVSFTGLRKYLRELNVSAELVAARAGVVAQAGRWHHLCNRFRVSLLNLVELQRDLIERELIEQSGVGKLGIASRTQRNAKTHCQRTGRRVGWISTDAVIKKGSLRGDASAIFSIIAGIARPAGNQ